MQRGLLLLLVLCCDAQALRVAWIGNSYTYFNDLPRMFVNLSASAGIAVEYDQVTPGGSSLFQHADLLSKVGLETTAMLLQPRGWDFVVLQDQSETPGGGKDTDDDLDVGLGQEKSLKALRGFYSRLLQHAGAEAVLYSTWGRHDGDPPNAECCGYGDFESMTSLTTSGYDKYAAAIHGVPVRVAPAGRAFELSFSAAGPEPLANTTSFTCLYHHDESSTSCALDGAGLGGHPSTLGTYMIACVFFGTIHGRSPVGLSWAPPGLLAQDIAAVQNWAHDAVFAKSDQSEAVHV